MFLKNANDYISILLTDTQWFITVLLNLYNVHCLGVTTVVENHCC